MKNYIFASLEVRSRAATARRCRGGNPLLYIAVLATLSASAVGGCAGELATEDPVALDETSQEMIYGIDNRQDVYVHSDLSLRRIAQQAAVALVPSNMINETNPNNITFPAPSLGAAFNLCPGQRFAADPTAAWCSGTLIDNDLVLTAGHCISDELCADFRVVFNYYRASATTLKPVTSAEVFRCAGVVVRKLEAANGEILDYGIIRLDRPAMPRFAPAPVRQDRTALPAGQRMGVVGTPSGILNKIDTGGRVRDPRPATLDFFTANTDTFSGNSGSGVYDLRSYLVAGILARGTLEQYRSSGTCSVAATCPENGCAPQEVTYVGPALDELCFLAPTNRLCGPRNFFSYGASNTSGATTNTTRQFIGLSPGQTITVATCGIHGASGVGDTLLRLIGPNGAVVASSDDVTGCGLLSRFAFTVPPLLGGVHEIQAGCFGAGSCSGTVAYSVTGPRAGSYSFATVATNSATTSTANLSVSLSAGQTITLGSCGVAGAEGDGDTWLRLLDSANREVASNDDASGCGLLSRLSFTAPQAGVFQIRAGCYLVTACSGTVAYTITDGGSRPYTATNTASATTNTTNFNVSLAVGQTLMAGTCGVAGSAGTGDTVLRLFDPANREVAFSDDAGGTCVRLSNLTFTVTTAGMYQLRAGCFSSGACNGTVAYTLSRNDGSGSYSYIALNTNGANMNTVDQPIVLEGGQTFRFGTCGLAGAAGSGDTLLRLFGPDSEQVASSDDACGGVLSNASFTVPAATEGAYLIRGGCFSSGTCTGGVAFTVE